MKQEQTVTETCRQILKLRNVFDSCGWISTVGRRGTGQLNSLFCSLIGSEIKAGINSGMCLSFKNKKQ